MPQTVEIDVRTRVDGHEGLATGCTFCHVLLDASHRQRAGRFGDRAGIVIDILDGGAELVIADGQHLIDAKPAHLETMGADLCDGHAIGERADARQNDALIHL